MQQSTPFVLVRLLWVSIGSVAFLLALLLLFASETLPGRLVAVGVMAVCLAPVFISAIRGVAGRWTAGLVMVAGFVCFGIAYVMTPNGRSGPEAAFRSVYGGTASYHKLSPARIVPEVDQHLMGTYVFTLLDPFIDAEQAEELRKKFLNVYLPMRENPEFASTGNVMGICYRDIFFGRIDSGHSYVYRPPGFEGEVLPVFIFLHGSLGNFKGNLWCWKTFADRHGFAIVAPSFGQGNWDESGGVDEIERAVEFCRNSDWIDSERIFLSGISNGGLGVTRGMMAMPEAFQGVFYLSPVLEGEQAARPEYISACGEKPVLIVSGEVDRRIPKAYLDGVVEAMRWEKLNVTYETVPGEDHFLFFSQPERVWNVLEKWLASQE